MAVVNRGIIDVVDVKVDGARSQRGGAVGVVEQSDLRGITPIGAFELCAMYLSIHLEIKET